VFVLIEGNFNVDKIRAAAEAMAQEAGGALKITRLGGFQIYRNQPVKPVLQG
jgi:hypothetical protein